ncbi:MAG: hypothetical protein HN392_09700 [Anaerolineae bacterium]|jgi:hypothetical protein|nr:hypothetical protein [Anaerolineae bacterium]MBT7074594.1 hypothetical protein [Anaerolineae bacterium]MBT7782304.1 hypothetical protein [Anaerolineae bacterium]
MSNNLPQRPENLLGGMIFGSIFFLVGSLIVLVAADIIHADPSSFNAPRWVIGAAGGSFMLAGTMVALQSAFGPEGMETKLYLWLQFLMGLAFMLFFSSIFLWVGFGEGEREFSTSTTLGPITTNGTSNISSGRLIFGSGGVFMIFFTILTSYINLKKIYKGR